MGEKGKTKGKGKGVRQPGYLFILLFLDLFVILSFFVQIANNYSHPLLDASVAMLKMSSPSSRESEVAQVDQWP